MNKKDLKDKLSYIKTINGLVVNTDQIENILELKPDNLYKWIQVVRGRYGNEDKNITEVVKTAQLLSDFIIQNPKYSNKLIWLIKDLLGHDPQLFSTINLSQKSLKFLKSAIESNTYENYPFVVLSRYVQPSERKHFVISVISYADQNNDDMSWAMAGEACDTLAYLNLLPKECMACYARHLNDHGCDGYPSDQIISNMHLFKKYDRIIIKELLTYISLGIESSSDGVFLFKNLMKFVNNSIIAKQVLLPISDKLVEYDIITQIRDSDFFDKHNDSSKYLVMLYGQLQALIHGDL